MAFSWSQWFIPVLDIAVVISVYALARSYRSKGSATLPPGPPSKPHIGNLLDFPKDDFVKTFNEWKQQYGDVVYAKVLGQSTLVLNSRQAIEDLFVERSKTYADRPSMIMGMKLSGWEWSIVFRQAGLEHSEGRKVLLSGLGPSGVKQWAGLIAQETDTLMHKFANNEGSEFLNQVKLYLADVVLKIAYGERINRDHGEELLEANVKALEYTTDILSKFWLVDVIPFLQHLPKWLPGTNFLKVADTNRRWAHKMRDWPFAMATQDIKNGIISPSLTAQSLEDGHNERSVMEGAGVLYAAGLDTTFTTISTFVLAMVLYPEIQTKAQAEIDRFLEAEGRLPEYQDRKSLPYMEALLKELLRWNPPVPLAIPHVSREDDHYRGMWIPKGSVIFPNIWLAMHDTETWNNPEEFQPERFLDPEGRFPDPAHFVFGFGKRVCPGKHLADRILYAMVVQTLGLFSIELAPGETRPLKAEFTPGVLSYPKVPKSCLKLRNRGMLPTQ